jgi:hypothetical protein
MNVTEDTHIWRQPTRIPPLRKDGSFVIHWNPQTNIDRFGATYEDMWGRRYTTICKKDLNEIQRGWHLSTWHEGDITAEWTRRRKKLI